MPVILRLAIPTPLRRHFDYLPPVAMDPEAAAELQPGARLRVPFGQRKLVGILIEVRSDSPVARGSLKPALEVLDQRPLIDARMLELCQWSAAYYLHPPGEVYAAAFSKRLRSGRQPEQNAWRLTSRGLGLPPGALKRAPRQAEVVAALAASGVLGAASLRSSGVSSAALRELTAKGLIERCELTYEHSAELLRAQGPALSEEQVQAVSQITRQLGGFSCHLLQGVTGSGKTEVYLRVIEACLNSGRQALVLVPEIGLTPQTLARFQERFHARIALLHSGLGDGERDRAWDEARTGAARIVLGTRSAIFTPCRSLGVIVVDEEHDASFRQQDGFRYSARDLAVKRGQIEACPVILGSATPSLESLHNALRARYSHLRLTRRASGSLPSLASIDLRRQPLQAGLSPALLEAVEATLEQGQQVLLFLNRRGFATSLQCHDCAWIAHCDHCDARLTVHRRKRQLRCHHCAARRPINQTCPDCGSAQLLTNGLGTEQTEDFLRARLSRWPVYRVDSDSVASPADLHALLDNIGRGEPCILLGTQMLTKGHHFPAVTTVGVIDSDALLFSADFRGEERMAQLLTQVAGRAGRELHSGQVLLQTHHPDHPLVRLLLETDYSAIAAELLQRRLAARMPPAGQLAMVRADTPREGAGETFLQALRQAAAGTLAASSKLLGPLPSAMPRRAGRYRSQLLCLSATKGDAAASARALVTAAQALPQSGDLNWFLEVDPLDTL